MWLGLKKNLRKIFVIEAKFSDDIKITFFMSSIFGRCKTLKLLTNV